MRDSKILWVASYPKSGNTWIRFLLANMRFGPITQSDEIEAKIPGIHSPTFVIKSQFQGWSYLKTHWRYGPEMPMYEKSEAAIYIVRHPLDVLVSHLNYFGVLGDPEMEQRVSEEFIEFGGLKAWSERGMGTWFENVESWKSSTDKCSLLFLKYEDVIHDPLSTARSISKFAELDNESSEISDAVQRSSFPSLKAMELAEIKNQQQGFFLKEFEGKRNKDFKFMHSGTPGNYRDILPDSLLTQADKRYGTHFKTLGYSI